LLQPLALDQALDLARDQFLLVPDYLDPRSMLTRVYNAFMGSTAGHPLLEAMCASVLDNVLTQIYGVDELDITGPTALGRVFTKFFGLLPVGTLGPGRTVFSTPPYNNTASRDFLITAFFNDRCQFIFPPTRVPPPKGSECGLFKVKFPNYYTVMYPKHRKPHYGKLWRRGLVYDNRKVANTGTNKTETKTGTGTETKTESKTGSGSCKGKGKGKGKATVTVGRS
jgi:hypothetical protein